MIKTLEGYFAKFSSGYSPEYVREEAQHEKEAKKLTKEVDQYLKNLKKGICSF